ncbi:lgrA [Symbiodinium pilosum]|uniref:LgrA protein n=1 Tax=Symbiodinium pilosum TaxID=2952 RepID=A0A812K4M1_SYMPI|nr:lgrA [Symbiodinium pilosum]
MRKIRKRQREEQDATNKRLHEMQQQVQDNTYDIESHARINAHLLQKKLQEDARNASLSLTIEGFPKDASEQDRTAFANWVLQQANSKDRDAHTRRFLKAAMEAINESQTNDNFEFYPSWNENAVRTKYSHGYLIWLHFSYATASCDIFADEQVFDDVQAHFESKLEAISINAGRGKGKGKSKDKGGEERKGTSKGVYAAMDYAFDPKIPFWCKFVCVHDWRNNVQVQQALKDEDKAQARMDTFEG